VLETCWSSDAGGLLDVLLSTFGLPFSVATIRANITALNETLGEGFNIFEASVVDDFGDYLAGKEPADFGPERQRLLTTPVMAPMGVGAAPAC